MSYYVSPRFLNKLAVHITKNYLDLQQVKVPLILGIHGRKGEGKTFQCELVFERMGVEVVHISGGELESPDAGDPARLIRLRYREAAELVRVRGNMAVLMINDLDAGAGRFDRMTQYTVNTQLVNNTLMNIADKPTNVQLPGSYDEKALPRIPIIATGNDFATLYAPLIRDGRMQKFYWEPSHDDRIGIVSGLFSEDGLSPSEIESLVNQFEDQAIDFFGAVRSQIYDEQITQFIHSVGIKNVASRVVNTLKLPSFAKPNFQLSNLIEVGNTLAKEQAYVRTMGLVSEYNQAVTPTGEAVETPRRRDSALLTPPANNPLRPYSTHHKQERLGKRDAQLAFSASSGSSEYASANNSSIGPAVRSLETSVGSEAVKQLRRIMAQGHRVGIEHVDQRRFSTNSWQCYTTLESRFSDREAIASLDSCLSQYPDHYVRLVSIDRQTKRRMGETIVQRPS